MATKNTTGNLFDDLFDPPEGRARRDAGIEKTQAHTPVELQDAIQHIWENLCCTRLELTSDDLWFAMPVDLRTAIGESYNIIGATIRASATMGWVTSTGRTVRTKRPSGQARAITVWRSKRFTK